MLLLWQSSTIVDIVCSCFCLLMVFSGAGSSADADEPSCASQGCRLYKLGSGNYESVRFVSASDLSLNRTGSVNTLFAATKPAMIMVATSSNDVIAGVLWAKRSNVRVTARSGGHSYTGCSLLGGGLVIDVSSLNAVRVDTSSATARIGAGAKLGAVYDALDAHGFALPAGTCRTVGIAGLALGGGHGALARESGLTLDSITEMDVVTADGELHVASATANPDLFWGLRGGGHNLGIVTSFTFKLQRSHLWFFYTETVPWDAAATQVVLRWQEWAFNEPRASWHSLHLSNGYVKLIGMYSAELCRPDCTWNLCESDSDCAAIPGSYCSNGICHGSGPNTTYVKRRLTMGLGAAGSWDKIFNWVWREAVTELDFAPQNQAHAWLGRSLYVLPGALLNETALDTMREALHSVPDGADTSINFDSYGGAIADVAADATAFVHRNALLSIQAYASLDSEEEEGASAGLRTRAAAWLRGLMKDLEPWDGGAYINYAVAPQDGDDDKSREAAMQEYFGGNAERLRGVKAKYDPSGLLGDICALPAAAASES